MSAYTAKRESDAHIGPSPVSRSVSALTSRSPDNQHEAETFSAAAFSQSFQNPPGEYRPAPFTILNDEYESGQGERQLTHLLESLARVGYGGAYLHPRPGLITEYLSPRWFELIRHCIQECKRLGLIPHLYDENSYPSGFSGGHVAARVPEARSRYVHFVRGRGPGAVPGVFLSLFQWEAEAPGGRLTKKDVDEETEWIAFIMQDLPPSMWHGETSYPSLLDPRTAEAFLETTYDAYRQQLGDLWTETPSIFTDEPHLPGMEHGPWSPGLHLTPYVLGEFYHRLGYDLTHHLPELFYDRPGCRKVRYDFYDLCHQLWMDNWALPLERWCRKQGIKLTGHYLEHDWPCPYATPGHVHLLAHMDWPGTDMLSSFMLKGHDFHDIQGFEPVPPGIEPHGLFFLRQVHSLANQLGKERVMNECWGAGGGESAPEDWMRIGRWLIVNGTNLLVPHASWDTIRGARKADHPPNFAPQSPWFEYLRPLNDELTRLCWVSNQGECRNRVLVIDSLTSGFCASRKAESSDPKAIAALEDVLLGSAENALPSTLPIKQAADRFTQDLADAQIDFDLGDEYVLEEFGHIQNGHLAVGERAYSVVALIPGADHLRLPTIQYLRDFLAHGGRLLAVDAENILVNGDQTEPWANLRREFGAQMEFCTNNQDLLHRIAELAPPRLVFPDGDPWPGVIHMHRWAGGGEIFLIVNSSPESLSRRALLRTSGSAVLSLAPATGQISTLSSRPSKAGLEITLHIPGGAACVLFVSDDATASSFPSSPVPASRSLSERRSAPPKLVEARRVDDNILAIDYCALELGGKKFPFEDVMTANQRYWKAHGLDSNGWNNLIQFRDQILARDKTMPSHSGGVACYQVAIEEGVSLAGISLVVECPELWTVRVNGTPTTFAEGRRFRDPRFLKSDISALLRPGTNEITLTARPFTVRQEIAPIYLLGNFACDPSGEGFRIAPSRPLTWGSWSSQGMPFYDSEVVYRLRVPGVRRLEFPRTHWTGSLLIVQDGDCELGRIFEAPWSIDLPEVLPDEITVRVIGLPFNLFGPWHDSHHRWGIAVPIMWTGISENAPPKPGADYRHMGIGLLEPPLAW